MTDLELQVSISSDEPSLCVEVILRGQGYSPDVATDIKRRAVDAFRDGVVILNEYGYGPEDVDDDIVSLDHDRENDK